MMMENEEEIQFPTEALRLYFKEVKDLQHEPEYEIENVHMNGKYSCNFLKLI